jgi:hypothetical protein
MDLTDFKTSLVSLATESAAIVFRPAPGSVTRDYSQRITRRELISGRDVIESRGFDWSFPIITYFANLDNNQRQTLETMVTGGSRVFWLQNAEGVFVGAVHNIKTDSNPVFIEFWPSGKLENDFTNYGFFASDPCTYYITEADYFFSGAFEAIPACTLTDPGLLTGDHYVKYVNLSLPEPACLYFEVYFSAGGADIYFRIVEGGKGNIDDPGSLIEDGAYESLAWEASAEEYTILLSSVNELDAGNFDFDLYSDPGACGG